MIQFCLDSREAKKTFVQVNFGHRLREIDSASALKFNFLRHNATTGLSRLTCEDRTFINLVLFNLQKAIKHYLWVDIQSHFDGRSP